MAIDALGDALGAGGGTYARDDDPDLVGDASAFGMKTVESLLDARPEHPGLLLAATRGFTQYAYAFLQTKPDYIEGSQFEASRILRKRAWRMYRRARRYGIRGLNVSVENAYARLRKDTRVLNEFTKEQIGFLYWTAAATAAAVAIDKEDAELAADLDLVEAMMKRALALNPNYGGGAIYDFLISWDGSRPAAAGGSVERAKKHYSTALRLSKGLRLGPKLAYAESVCIQTQDKTQFIRLLKETLAFDIDSAPEHRLANLIAQRRARWLLTQIEDLFI